MGRLASEKDLPYNELDHKCDVKKVKNSLVNVEVTGFEESFEEPDEDLVEMISKGAVSVGIKCGGTDMMHYRTGIYECSGKCNCMKPPDHAVVVVGYAPDYWKIRNSWGPEWGDGGYILMSRKTKNMCNIASMPTRPLLQCKKGKVCKGWDFSNNEDWAEEDEEDVFDTGDIEMCGEIQHYGGLCIDLDTTKNHYAVLSNIGCDREFCSTSKGYLVDAVTGMCLTVGPKKGVIFGACSAAGQWEHPGKHIYVKGKAMCMHVYAGNNQNPTVDTEVEVSQNCGGEYREFKMTPSMCWEEDSGVKMKKMKKKGKPMQEKSLDDAKDLCLETKGCTGVFKQKKKYFLSSSKRLYKSKKPDKVFILKTCVSACEAGTQRCTDGECREKCDGIRRNVLRNHQMSWWGL